MIEIQCEDLFSIGWCLNLLRGVLYWFVLFCDDLFFSYDDVYYKLFKVVLDGGIEGCLDNVVFYVILNCCYLMLCDMIENEWFSVINLVEVVEEKVLLLDWFGLWFGFYFCDQDDYLLMICGYCDVYGVDIDDDMLRVEVIEWQVIWGS